MSFLDLTSTPVQTNEVIPAGIYVARIAKAEVKDTKDMNGQYISCQFKVTSGDHEGRTFFNMYNIKNNNPKAVEIGLSQLKSMLFHAGKAFTLNNVTDLEGAEVVVKLGVKSDDYGDKNVVKGYTTKTMLKTAMDAGSTIPF